MGEVDHTVLVVANSRPEAERLGEHLRNFAHIKYCTSTVDALQNHELTPVPLIITDYELDELDGLDLAESIVDFNRDIHHCTNVLMVTDEIDNRLATALGTSVQGIVERSKVERLLDRAARNLHRLATNYNLLAAENRDLRRRIDALEYGQLKDPVTGLGNRQMAEQSLEDHIRQIESRGGAVCFLFIRIDNYNALMTKYNESIARELILAVSERLLHLVRPLDVVTYFDTGLFALVLSQPSIQHCTADCYARIFEGLRLKSFSTRAGYLPADIAMSICASEAQTGPPAPERIIKIAFDNLVEAASGDEVVVHHMTEYMDLEESP